MNKYDNISKLLIGKMDKINIMAFVLKIIVTDCKINHRPDFVNKF